LVEHGVYNTMTPPPSPPRAWELAGLEGGEGSRLGVAISACSGNRHLPPCGPLKLHGTVAGTVLWLPRSVGGRWRRGVNSMLESGMVGAASSSAGGLHDHR
jgi:hypothetical protein